ncbi:MAG: hypothetical protein ABSE08_14375 [Syntrophobacteraceae bacterium]|jgi:hypothetical protein
MLKQISIRLLVVLSLAFIPLAAYGQDIEANGPVGSSVSVTLPANNGSVKCTADITSSGTIAGGKHVDAATTLYLSTGVYQVGFKKPCANVTAAKGYARWVQPDTFGIGFTGARYCTTADKNGVPAAVYVQCFDGNGNLADTSFFMFIAR